MGTMETSVWCFEVIAYDWVGTSLRVGFWVKGELDGLSGGNQWAPGLVQMERPMTLLDLNPGIFKRRQGYKEYEINPWMHRTFNLSLEAQFQS